MTRGGSTRTSFAATCRGARRRVTSSTPLCGRLPLGLDTRIGSEGAHLSGGERQRLAVARTLLTGSEVVLLDEPMAHLDEEIASTLMDDLRAALSGQIVVLVTHHLVDRRQGDQRVDLDRLVLPAARV